jgi:hypothetical protein
MLSLVNNRDSAHSFKGLDLSSRTSSSTWQAIVNAARKIGNYIPEPCGGGVFGYVGTIVGPGVANLQVARWYQYDTREGGSSGLFTEFSGGGLVMGGYGQQHQPGRETEHYLFFGVGGSAKVVGGNISEFVSDGPSAGLAFEGNFGRVAGGTGFYANFDSATSCYDHRMR